MRQYTNESQTTKLIELGFEKPKGWCVEGISSRLIMYKHKEDDEEFNYSIGELIDMLMKIIGVRISFDSMYGGKLHLIVKRLVGDKWDILYGKVGKELADLLVDAIVKLKEEGVI